MSTKPDLNKPAFRLFPEAARDIQNNICPSCKEHIDPESFKDEDSRREYLISGLCPACQEAVFG